MAWLQLRLNAAANAAQLSDLLSDLGAAAVTLQDAADQPVLEPPPGSTPLWSSTRVIGLFDASTDMPAVIAHLRAALPETDMPGWDIIPLEERDWGRAWMEHFHPLRCGNRLWICPSWCEPPEPDAVNVMLDPGLAFGTGTHATTAMCLEWLDDHPPQAHTVIDFGCGSGILAVAAALLGAREVWAIDHDPQALLATRENAAKNNVGARVHALMPSELPDDLRGDLVLANILALPLIELAPRFAAMLRPAGHIVLSGILRDQAPVVAAAYTPYFALDAPLLRDDWVCLTGIRLS